MKAPEIIYVQLPSRNWIGRTWDEKPIKEGDNPNWKNATNIEYTRTDILLGDHVSEELEEEIECSLPKPACGWNEDYFGKSEPAYSMVQMKEFAKHFFELGLKVQKEQMLANTTDAMIGLPYENKDGGYTHLIDISRPLPVGKNKIAIIFKED